MGGALALALLAVIAWSEAIGALRLRSADADLGPVGSLSSVTLSNGQVFFGTLDAVNPDSIVLDDVYYVTTSADQQNNRQNRLVSREREDWHGPRRMWLPREKILLLEDVGPDSQVAKLIAQAEAQRK